MAKNTRVSVKLVAPFIEVEGVWEADESQRLAAWELYVELVTRIAVIRLREDEGLLREALTSLYSLFETTRSILKTRGPGVAIPRDDGQLSFGYLAVAVLNLVVRPVLAKWHPLLQEYELSRRAGVSPLEHERAWDDYTTLRDEIETRRGTLLTFANILGDICGVPSLVLDRPAASE